MKRARESPLGGDGVRPRRLPRHRPPHAVASGRGTQLTGREVAVLAAVLISIVAVLVPIGGRGATPMALPTPHSSSASLNRPEQGPVSPRPSHPLPCLGCQPSLSPPNAGAAGAAPNAARLALAVRDRAGHWEEVRSAALCRVATMHALPYHRSPGGGVLSGCMVSTRCGPVTVVGLHLDHLSNQARSLGPRAYRWRYRIYWGLCRATYNSFLLASNQAVF